VENVIVQVLDFTGLAGIVVEPEALEAAPGPQSVAGPASPEEIAQTAKLDEWLKLLVAKVRDVSFVAIGVTGLLALIYAAVSFMVEIERAANTIYHAPTGRSWVRRITQYWTTLTLGTLFLVGTFYIGGSFKRTVGSLTAPDRAEQRGAAVQKDPADTTPGDDPGVLDSEAAELLVESNQDGQAATDDDAGAPNQGPQAPSQSAALPEDEGFVVAAASVAVSLVIAFLLLLFLYMTIPNARVSVQCAAIGAAFAAIMWEAGKQGFTLFVVHSATQRLYGAIALVPLFLLWVYITWIIVLFGLQISYVLQNFRTFSLPEEEDHGPALVDSLTLLRLMVAVAERFGAGQTMSLAEAARAVGTDERTALTMLQRLVEAGFVHRVPIGQEREGFTLARPADEISARELLELTDRIAGESPARNEPERLAQLRRAQLETAARMSLADLMRPGAADDDARAIPRTQANPMPAG
jgi:uncharacterized BrkB/YihY/UPF0761 family membrane protein/DNA-binding IscR family transcriptional regulator